MSVSGNLVKMQALIQEVGGLHFLLVPGGAQRCGPAFTLRGKALWTMSGLRKCMPSRSTLQKPTAIRKINEESKHKVKNVVNPQIYTKILNKYLNK
jgi:hypothetical protein